MDQMAFDVRPSHPHTPSPIEGGRKFVARAARLVTVLLIGRLATDMGEDLCQVRNVSAGGMMLMTRLPLRPGQRLLLELRNLTTVAGTVAWVNLPRVGVKFDSEVDVADLIAMRMGLGVRRARAPRINVRCPLLIRRGSDRLEGMLLNISQTGGRIALAEPVRPMDELFLEIPGYGTKRCDVRWQQDGEAGIQFVQPIPFAPLAEWLQNQSNGPAFPENA